MADHEWDGPPAEYRNEAGFDINDPDDYAAFQLYAAGPWGEMDRFLDDGVRVSTDSHSPDIYRAQVAMTSRILREHDSFIATERDQLQRDLDRLLGAVKTHHDRREPYVGPGRIYETEIDRDLYKLAEELEAGHREKEGG